MEFENLIKQCRQGDIEAMGELYRTYSKNALGTAYLMAGHKGIAEDIVQEAFIQCFRNLDKIKTPEAFDVWFYKILTRTGWHMIKTHNAIIPVDNPDIEACSLDSLTEVNNDFCLTNIEIADALDKLSLPLRTVIVLHYFNDMSIREISRVLDCFQGTVKSRLHKARAKLRELLGEEDDSGIAITVNQRKECEVNAK